MSLLLISVSIFLGSLFGKFLFKKWFNHFTMYCIIFGGAIFLYELKLLPYIDISPEAWFVIIVSFLSFLAGVLTIFASRFLSSDTPTTIPKSDITLKIFLDNGSTIKYILVLLSAVSLYSAIEFWIVLIKQYGSIPGVFLNANEIYRLNVAGKLKGTTPYIFLFSFVAVFFSGIYTAYKGKFTLLTFIPLISVIIREIAGSGRVGMLIGLLGFIFSFLLFRHLLKNDRRERYKFSKGNLVFALTILFTIFIIGASLVRLSRAVGSSEDFSGASRELKQTKENIIISPSVYLYLSSDIGVLTKYLSSKGENASFGENTFKTFYSFLSKFTLIEERSEFQKGYYIPMWTNTGTYLRELHADFGIAGVVLGPFFIGLLITWLWFKFYEKKNLLVFVFLVNLNIVVALSFFVMATRILYWSTSLVMCLLFIPIIEKIVAFRQFRQNIDKLDSVN